MGISFEAILMTQKPNNGRPVLSKPEGAGRPLFYHAEPRH